MAIIMDYSQINDMDVADGTYEVVIKVLKKMPIRIQVLSSSITT